MRCANCRLCFWRWHLFTEQFSIQFFEGAELQLTYFAVTLDHCSLDSFSVFAFASLRGRNSFQVTSLPLTSSSLHRTIQFHSCREKRRYWHKTCWKLSWNTEARASYQAPRRALHECSGRQVMEVQSRVCGREQDPNWRAVGAYLDEWPRGGAPLRAFGGERVSQTVADCQIAGHARVSRRMQASSVSSLPTLKCRSKQHKPECATLAHCVRIFRGSQRREVRYVSLDRNSRLLSV